MQEVQHADQCRISAGEVSFDYARGDEAPRQGHQDAHGRRGRPLQEERHRPDRGLRLGHRQRQRQDRRPVRRNGDRDRARGARVRLGGEADPRPEVRAHPRHVRDVAVGRAAVAAVRDRRGRVGDESHPLSAGSGTGVLLLEALPQVLPLEDEEISKAVAREIKQNVRIETDAKVEDADVSNPESLWCSMASRRVRLSRDGGGPGARRGRPWARRGRHRPRRARPDQGGWAPAHLTPRRLGDRRHGAGPALAHKASDEGIIAVEDSAGRTSTRSTTRFIPAASRSAIRRWPRSDRRRRARRGTMSWWARCRWAQSARRPSTRTAA